MFTTSPVAFEPSRSFAACQVIKGTTKIAKHKAIITKARRAPGEKLSVERLYTSAV
jgi:hypothetical protein